MVVQNGERLERTRGKNPSSIRHFDYNYLKDFRCYKLLFEAMSEDFYEFRNEIHTIVPLLPVLLNVFVVPSVAPTAG